MVDRKTQYTGNILCHLHQSEARCRTDHGCLKIRLTLKRQLHTWNSLALHHHLPLLLQVSNILGLQEAKIKLDLGVIRYNIGQYTTRDDAWIDTDAFSPSIETLKL